MNTAVWSIPTATVTWAVRKQCGGSERAENQRRIEDRRFTSEQIGIREEYSRYAGPPAHRLVSGRPESHAKSKTRPEILHPSGTRA